MKVDTSRRKRVEGNEMPGNFLRDLRYALRTLRNNPAFTTVAVAAVALGIGVNISIFTLYDALALRPIAVKDLERVIRLFRAFEVNSEAESCITSRNHIAAALTVLSACW